ncbi:serine/threonine-protein kinase [Myxococcota bacterium]
MQQGLNQERILREALTSHLLERLKPGDVLGGYQLLVPIARGGVGLVWAARRAGRLGLPQVVALKTALQPADEQTEQAFFDEASVAASIDHPNVCRVHDLGEEQGIVFLAMDWIDGASLANLVTAIPDHRLDWSLAAHIVAEACSGLHAAHELRDEEGRPLEVVHRDATPQNIMLSSKGAVKVTDFGVVKSRDQAHATKTGEVKGKLSYFAPEQLTGQPCDRRVDVFALGAVLYLATTGRSAFAASNAGATVFTIVNGQFELPSSLVSNYPPALEAIVLRALAPNPDDRFCSAAEFRAELCRFIRNHGTATGPTHVSRVLLENLGPALAHRLDKIRTAQAEHDSAASGSRIAVSPACGGRNSESARPSALSDGQDAGSKRQNSEAEGGVIESGRPISLSDEQDTGSSPGSGHTAPPITVRSAVALNLSTGSAPRLRHGALWLGTVALVAAVVAAWALRSRSGGADAASVSASNRTAIPAVTATPVKRAGVPPRTAESEPVAIAVRVVPDHATISVDGKPPNPGPLQLTGRVGQSGRLLLVRARGYEPQHVLVAFDHSHTEVIELARRRGSKPQRGAQSTQHVGQTETRLVTPVRHRRPRRTIDVTDPFQE